MNYIDVGSESVAVRLRSWKVDEPEDEYGIALIIP